MKQKRNYSVLTSRSIAKTSYTIRSSGVLLQTGRVFLMTFMVVVKSYMEVSNETSDTEFCHHYIAHKRLEAQSLLSRLDEVGLIDPQVALTLLRMCGGFC